MRLFGSPASLLLPLHSKSVSSGRGGAAAAVCLRSFVTMMDNAEFGRVQL